MVGCLLDSQRVETTTRGGSDEFLLRKWILRFGTVWVLKSNLDPRWSEHGVPGRVFVHCVGALSAVGVHDEYMGRQGVVHSAHTYTRRLQRPCRRCFMIPHGGWVMHLFGVVWPCATLPWVDRVVSGLVECVLCGAL